jgi:hypothetical protein
MPNARRREPRSRIGRSNRRFATLASASSRVAKRRVLPNHLPLLSAITSGAKLTRSPP